MSDNGVFTNVFTYLLLITVVLIFLILIYFIYLNCRCGCCHRSGYENLESESALSPLETHFAKSSFYAPSQSVTNSKCKPENQEPTMPTPVDFPVFRMLHERFKQQVTISARKYYELKENAGKPLIEL